jgi:hypothetical protein
MQEQAAGPKLFGVTMPRFASVSADLNDRLGAPTWCRVLPEIAAIVRIWDSGRWEWCHTSEMVEQRGIARDVEAAAKAAESAILERATTVVLMANPPTRTPGVAKEDRNPNLVHARKR